MPLPDPVDDDPGGKRIVWSGDGLGQFAATTPLGIGWWRFSSEDLNESARNQFPLLSQIPPQGNMHVVLTSLLKNMSRLIFFWSDFLQAIQLGTHRSDFLLRLFTHRFLDVFPLDLEPFAFVIKELIDGIILVFDCVLTSPVGVNNSLRNERVLANPSVLENSGDRVVVLRRDRIELMIMTSRTSGS